MLNWVMADGPPNSAKVYDNNGSYDFHALVPKTVTEEVYWSEVEKQLYRRLREGTLSKEAAVVRKASCNPDKV